LFSAEKDRKLAFAAISQTLRVPINSESDVPKGGYRKTAEALKGQMTNEEWEKYLITVNDVPELVLKIAEET
jgi:hypothetical protein